MEVLDLLAEAVQVRAALLEALVLRHRALREISDVREPLVEGLQAALFLGQLVRLVYQRLEVLAERIGPLIERRQVTLLRGERLHPAFGLFDRALQHAEPLVERLERLLLERELLDVRAHHVHERATVLLHPRRLAVELVAHLRGCLEPGAGFLDNLLDPRHRLLAARGLFHALVQVADLDVHVPDHLVQAVRLHDRAIDRVPLPFQRLGLLSDVLGQRVERAKLLIGRLAQFLELHERPEPLLEVLDRLDGRCRILARLPRGHAKLGDVLRQLACRAAHLVEILP